jgi:sugar O-acyltransferase (sialic acid O-acetyltransferase NeuD family)
MSERPKPKVFVFGAGGHAKVVIDVLERGNFYEVAFAVDDSPNPATTTLCGYPVITGREQFVALRSTQKVSSGIVAVGDNPARAEISKWLLSLGFKLVTIQHPSAQLARGVILGDGSVVMAGCVINPDTSIGRYVIINTGSTVDHDCTIGDAVHIAPGCNICGGVSVGAGTFVGAGTTIIPGLKIGSNVLIGAGSTVLSDIPDNAKVAGSPCRNL